jgi:hypothetical protein
MSAVDGACQIRDGGDNGSFMFGPFASPAISETRFGLPSGRGQTDVDFLTSVQARESIQQEGITLLSCKPLQEVWQARYIGSQ